MTTLIRFELSPGRDVLVETDSVDEGLIPVGRGDDGFVHVAGRLAEHLDSVRDAVAESLSTLRDALQPDQITISFGVSFTAEAGAVIAKTSLAGNLGVQMSWERTAEQQ